MGSRIILLTIATIVALGFAELVLLYVGIEQPFSQNAKRGSFYDYLDHVPASHYYTFAPNIQFNDVCDEFNYTKTTNNLGFVDELVPDTFPERTIVTFGDSFTEGAGAPYRKSWPHQLEAIINQTCPVKVINFGIAGSDPVYSLKYFEDSVLHKHPDVVILSINATDLDEVAIRGGYSRFQPDGRVKYRNPHCLYWLFRRSRFFRLLCKRLFGLDNKMWSADRVARERKLARSVISNVVSKFDSICKANDVRFLAALLPLPSPEVPEKATHSELNGIIGDQTENIDLHSKVHSSLTPSNHLNYYWPNDGHFNEHGYKLIAETIGNWLEGEVCLER